MDDKEVLVQTLNSTIQRQSRLTQSYEVEIANMTAEILKLKGDLESLTQQLASAASSDNSVKEKKGNASGA